VPDPIKQAYYRRHREARLKYQRDYYHRTKKKFDRRDELWSVLEPEKLAEKKKKKSDYNKAYYLRNKERIKARRKQK
tara:strand:- start:125 stop:355 length:231 start_codon:yes stop_codon:yes gene_type:complete